MTSCKLPVFDRYLVDPFVTCVVIVVIIVDVFVVVDDDDVYYDDDDDDDELSYVYTMCFLFKTHRPFVIRVSCDEKRQFTTKTIYADDVFLILLEHLFSVLIILRTTKPHVFLWLSGG